MKPFQYYIIKNNSCTSLYMNMNGRAIDIKNNKLVEGT